MLVCVQDAGMTFPEFTKRYFPGLTNKQIGQVAGVDRSTIARWKKENRPTPAGARNLAKAAKVPFDVVVGLMEPPEEEPFKRELEALIQMLGCEEVYMRAIGAVKPSTIPPVGKELNVPPTSLPGAASRRQSDDAKGGSGSG